MVGSNDKKGRNKLKKKGHKCLERESMSPVWKNIRRQINLPKEWMENGYKERCCFPCCLEQSKTTTAATICYNIL